MSCVGCMPATVMRECRSGLRQKRQRWRVSIAKPVPSAKSRRRRSQLAALQRSERGREPVASTSATSRAASRRSMQAHRPPAVESRRGRNVRSPARPMPSAQQACRPTARRHAACVTWSGSMPPPQNHSELTGGLPAAMRARVPRMVVQHHLRFAQQCAPAAACCRSSVPGRCSNRSAPSASAGSANAGSLRLARQAQVPARRRRRIDRESGVAEQRAQRRQQRLDVVAASSCRPVAAGQQARAVDVRAHPGRIGAQPCRLARHRRHRAGGSARRPASRAAAGRNGAAVARARPARRAGMRSARPSVARDGIGQAHAREARARRQQQRRGGHGLSLRTGRR